MAGSRFRFDDYAGNTVWLRFRLGSDAAFVVGEGRYLDELTVTPHTDTDLWFGVAATNGFVELETASNLVLRLSAANWSMGDSRAGQMIWTSNDPLESFARNTSFCVCRLSYNT